LRGLVWVIGLTVAVRVLTREDDYSVLADLFPPARDVTAIALIAWFLLRLIGRAERNIVTRAAREGRTLDPTAIDAIGKLVRAAVLITTALLVMQSFGLSIGGLVALGGVGGIALGFAAQSLVANLVGGLTIYASRPFKVGEWIILPGTEVMGEVQDIGWRATRIMGFDRRPFYVPNAMFNTVVVINHSRMTARRIMEHIHIRKDDIDRVRAIVADVNDMLAAHPGIHHDFFAFNFDTYGDFSLKLFLYAFTVSTDYNEYLNVKQDILVRIAEIVKRHGGRMAVPTSTVHVPEGLRLSRGREAKAEPLLESLVEEP
jgi:MscS family membrane protein